MTSYLPGTKLLKGGRTYLSSHSKETQTIEAGKSHRPWVGSHLSELGVWKLGHQRSIKRSTERWHLLLDGSASSVRTLEIHSPTPRGLSPLDQSRWQRRFTICMATPKPELENAEEWRQSRKSSTVTVERRRRSPRPELHSETPSAGAKRCV